MSTRMPAEAFPPGEFLREELEAREWSQMDLAEILGVSHRLVNEIVVGKRAVTPETAMGLAAALDTSAQLWLNLEASYQLYRLSLKRRDEAAVSQRARLFEKAPVREMARRGWIADSKDPAVLEGSLLRFLEIEELTGEPTLWQFAARKSTPYADVTPQQWAWLCRARQLARSVELRAPFDARSLQLILDRLRDLAAGAADVSKVSAVLAGRGVRLVVVEPIARNKIDGATFLVDDQPVIALSMRYDRIDYFWFTLMHELAHVKERDGIDNGNWPIDVEGERERERPVFERRADDFAAKALVDQAHLETFIKKVRPYFSAKKIAGFAAEQGVHPGIVVGQLQNRQEIGYSHSRRMLEKVREFLFDTTIVDGWGVQPAISVH